MDVVTVSNNDFAALNDLEGCLVDTEYPKRLAFIEVGREFFGIELSMGEVSWTLGLRREDVVQGLTDRFGDKTFLPEVTRDLSISVGEQILRRRDSIVNREFAKGIELMPGAPRLIDVYADLNATSGIVTSTKEKVAMEMLRAARIADEFDGGVFGDTRGLERGKPAPDPFLLGAKILRLNPEKCWAIGDSPVDVEAGTAAGMRTMYVPDRRIIAPNPRTVEMATVTVENLFEAADYFQRNF
jgi:beta-phosphoglucomutase-like phosphatase (HAD superfamily)